MTSTPTPPPEGERELTREKMHAKVLAELGWEEVALNAMKDLALQFPRDKVEMIPALVLRCFNALIDARLALAAAESKHAEEMRNLEGTSRALYEKATELQDKLDALESRHAEEMRKAHDFGYENGRKQGRVDEEGAYEIEDDESWAAFLASQKERKG